MKIEDAILAFLSCRRSGDWKSTTVKFDIPEDLSDEFLSIVLDALRSKQATEQKIKCQEGEHIDDLIKRKDVREAIRKYAKESNDWIVSLRFVEMASIVDDIPSIESVKHGRWITPVPGDGAVYCSCCKGDALWVHGLGYFEPYFCPTCGAKMDLKEEKDE